MVGHAHSLTSQQPVVQAAIFPGLNADEAPIKGARLIDGLKTNTDKEVVGEPCAVIGRDDETGAK